MSIAHNLAAIHARIESACARAERDPTSVRLLAASKTAGPDAVQEAMAAGQTLFGESRPQELRDKDQALGAGPTWHFIGHLQKNKIKYVVGRAALIHTIDSLELATLVSDRAKATLPEPQAVLVEVNIGRDPHKGGISPEEALALCHRVAALPGLRLQGLMAIPPWSEDPEDAAPHHAALAALAVAGRAEGLDLVELSMGMSDDLEVAIRHGATIVRVGTAIFGART